MKPFREFFADRHGKTTEELRVSSPMQLLDMIMDTACDYMDAVRAAALSGESEEGPGWISPEDGKR